jgi:hypothetical protein
MKELDMQDFIADTNEPDVEDLLADPILLAVLEYDGLTVDDVRIIVDQYRTNTGLEKASLN